MVDVYTSIMMDTIPITMVLLLISASIYALAYMASKFLNNDKLRKWVEGEIHQAFATALFLFLAVSFITVFVNLSNVFMESLIKAQGLDNLYDSITSTGRLSAGNNDEKFEEMYNLEKPLFSSDEEKERVFGSDSHIRFARVFLLHQLDRLDSTYTITFWANNILGTVFSIKFPESMKFVQSTTGDFFHSIRESIFSYLFYGFFFTYMQLALLDLIQVFFYFMFPVGIFFRAFSFTNSIGSTMIALSVGIYFIYPTILGVLLLTNYHVLDLNETDMIKLALAEDPGEFLNYQFQVIEHYEKVALPDKESSANFLSQTGNLILNFVRTIVLGMFLFPMVAFAVTYTFIHAFAGFMQANVSELGRGLIRLI